MKKTIPFKKDIIFPSNIAEVTSISLEHDIKQATDNLFKGDFIVSGEYKVTETSQDVQKFEHKLPCTIDIDETYDTSKATLDIEDFYYEILNSKILSINIEVGINDLEEKVIEELRENNTFSDKVIDVKSEDFFEEPKKEITRCVEEEVSEVKPILFNNLTDDFDTYKTYRICIVRDGDTIENIIEKYTTTRDDLSMYNDINDIKIGDKIIIPNANN